MVPRLDPQLIPLPEGFNAHAAVGRAIGWGRGNQQALARVQTITGEELAAQGFTADIARRWYEHYLNEVQRNPRNPSALGRATLMKRAHDLLRAYESHQVVAGIACSCQLACC